MKKITLYIFFLIAVILIRCDRDRTTPSAVFQNPLANPENGPAAGNPDGNASVPPEAAPEDILAESLKLLDLFAQRGRFVLSSGCEIPPGAKSENVQAMVSAVRNKW